MFLSWDRVRGMARCRPPFAGLALLGTLCGLGAVESRAAVINVGNTVLQPNKANQTITISVSGTDAVAGEDFFAQIGDGGTYNKGTLTKPVFQSADILTGTPFATNNTGQQNDANPSQHPLIFDASTTTNSGTVTDNGQLVTLTVDTTGVNSGVFSLNLSNVDANNGGPFTTDLVNSSGQTVPLTITNGTITISTPEPSCLGLVGIGASLLLRRQRRVKRDVQAH